MKVVCAPDSFKESMTAVEAAQAMARGVAAVAPDAQVVQLPMADGGEGTCATLAAAMDGELVRVATCDALGRDLEAHIAMAGTTAIIEAATACGLEHLTPTERDPRIATSRGVADLILAALDRGATEIVLGIGGTATNDAGAGMLTGLGARFLDEDGAQLPAGGAALVDLARIDTADLDPRLANLTVRIASDVDNPLLGADGASAVYGPQKGADSHGVEELDRALTRWAEVTEDSTGKAVRLSPGAGAAGGLGAAFLAFFNATLAPGAELVMDTVGFDEALVGADLVLTGEGSLDAQSAAGKVPTRVAARAHGVDTIIFAGHVDPQLSRTPPPGARAVVPIVAGVGDLETALTHGAANLERATAMALRLWLAHPPVPHT